MPSSSAKKSKLKILAASDFHGRFPSQIKKEKFDIVLTVGDFGISHKIRKYIFQSWKSDKEWWQICGKKKARELIKEEVDSGHSMAKKICSFGKPVFGIPGNNDHAGRTALSRKNSEKNYYKNYEKDFENFVDCDMARVELEDYQIIGYGRSSFPEKKYEREFYEYAVAALTELFKRAKKRKKPVIFICHNPPYGTLDKVGMKTSPMYGKSIGSDVAATIVKKFKPILCVSGHVHESPGKKKLGTTLVVNNGPAQEGRYAVITIQGKKVTATLKKRKK